MKKLHITLFGLFAMASASASAATLTFDDIKDGSIQNKYADVTSYQGFKFSRNLDWIDTVKSGWNYGAHSGDFTLLNNNGGIGIITDATGADFTFDGLWAKKWGTRAESGGRDSLFGSLEGYNNGRLVWSSKTSLNGSYEFYAGQAGLIDELRLGFGNYFLVDDISLSRASEVPVPAALFLFAPALIGLLGFRRKTKA